MDEETVRDIISKATQPPSISTEGPFASDITNSSVKINWETDRKSNSVIRFKAKEEGIDPENSNYLRQFGNFTEVVTEHAVILANLFSGTTYQYQAQSSDILGNTGKSEWKEFTTQVVPSIYDVIVSDINLNSVIVNWKTNVVSTSKIEYGKTINYDLMAQDKEIIKTAKHTIKLGSLESGTTYHFRVRGTDDRGNMLVSDDYTFTTFTLPQIEEYSIEEVEDAKIRIKWKTNVETDSTVKYTNLKDNISKKQGEDVLSSTHDFSLKGLMPGSEYLLQIQGRDAYGNEAVSDEFSVKTLQDLTSPKITQVKTETAVSSGKSELVQTIISWRTDEPSTSQVLWEQGVKQAEDLSNYTVEDENYTTNHIIVITSFKPASVYQFRVKGKDRSGNVAQSQDFTLLVPEKKKSVVQVIINNFEETFGWLKKLRQ